MTVYSVVLFIHVVGAVTLFAALGIEWRSLRAMRRATTVEEVRTLLGVAAAQPAINGFAAAAILLPGFYLATKLTAWSQGWISLALLGTFLIAGLGAAVTGPRMRGLRKACGEQTGQIPDTIRQHIRNPIVRMSFRMRVALGLGILFLMATKVGYGVATAVIVIAIVLALATSLAGGSSSSPSNSASK
jgi:hypothetical protein